MPIDVASVVAELDFLPNRTPQGGQIDVEWAATLSAYRDGGIYVVHWAGQSEWERHVGDEVVMVLEGSTTMTLLIDGTEHEHTLGPMQMIVVPERAWHRFLTPEAVKVMTISPQPTDHRVEHPSGPT
jgi:mannose-6-phosphate isomerase-like protein (cupin superfamily)